MPPYTAIINRCYAILRTVQHSIRQEFIVCVMSAVLNASVHYSVRQHQNGMLKALIINFLSIPRLSLSIKRAGKLSVPHELKQRHKRIR